MAHKTNVLINGVLTEVTELDHTAQEIDDHIEQTDRHVENTTVHVNADEKAAWNAKADADYVTSAISAAIGNAIGGSY